jgi:hypothetical protein
VTRSAEVYDLLDYRAYTLFVLPDLDKRKEGKTGFWLGEEAVGFEVETGHDAGDGSELTQRKRAEIMFAQNIMDLNHWGEGGDYTWSVMIPPATIR